MGVTKLGILPRQKPRLQTWRQRMLQAVMEVESALNERVNPFLVSGELKYGYEVACAVLVNRC